MGIGETQKITFCFTGIQTMKARHKAAKGTRYSYEDHYSDDDDVFGYDEYSYTSSQGTALIYLVITH